MRLKGKTVDQPRKTKVLKHGLPEHLRDLFWEYKFHTLSWERDRDLIAIKVLQYGNWENTCWLREKMGDEALREWICSRQGRGIDSRGLRYWETILGIPKIQVNKWLDHIDLRIFEGRHQI